MASNYDSRNAPRRPSMISELAARAQQTNWDENGSFKYFLRLAEKNRKEGKEAVTRNDLEAAFVAFARAASLVLEKLPNHRDYNTALTVTQRHNLSLNGQEILDNLGHLKPILLDRYDRWLSQHPNGIESDSPPTQTQRAAEQDDRERVLAQQETERLIQEEAQRAAREAEMARRRQQEEIYAPPISVASSAVTSARQAAGLTTAEAEQRHQRQQEEMHLRGQEMMRRRAEERQRAKESEYNGRSTPYYNSTSSSAVTTPSSALSMPTPATTTSASSLTPSTVYSEANKYPQAMSVPSSSIYHPPPVSQSNYYQPSSKAYRDDQRFLMPLESPSKNDAPDSSDSEAAPSWHPMAKQHRAVEHGTPTKPLTRSSTYPPPVTTTSPPPPDRIEYPQLMSQHQKTQGYIPSLNSMFRPDSERHAFNGDSLLLDGRGWDSRDLYSSNMLPNPSAAPPLPQPSHHHSYSYSHHHNPLPQPPSEAPYLGYPGPTRAPPPVPSSSYPGTQPHSASSSENTTPTESISRGVPGTPELKTVILPRESLSRFLTIAKVNTSRNRETCGLLLGKDRGNKFQVTTLLIPKQHATSDTCTMDEEELILKVTEERNLITLGWIHTHPTQSCFMSSVDLHTHSGFQRMLPESFAVVCAPKSTPNFGIFRLTDPPGLQTILDCTAKEAFHPHPDIPIYTDADRGHVQMKELSLEIVDLR